MKPVPASPVEAQFYLSGQMHPTPALNTMTEAVAIKGPLLPQRLARALRQVSLRHAALRTRFQAVDGAIVRILDDEVPNQPLDIREAPGTDQALADAAEAARRPLSPESTAWKAMLLRHGPDDHTFIFSAHRSIWDERSMEIFAAEVSALYHADPAQSGPLPAGGADAASAPGDAAEARVVEGARHLAAGLADVPALHGFPLKSIRPRILSVDAASVEIALDHATTNLLSQVAQSWGLDPFTLQTTAAAYVLAQYCGQQRLAIGMPFCLRPVHSQRALLGSHTAMLPLGFAAAAPTFAALASTFAESYSAARPFAATPFHAVVKERAARTDPSANPLFQIACIEDGRLVLQLDGCDCRPRAVSVPPQHVDLFLQFAPDELRLAYATEIIGDEIAASLGRSISAFLAAALREPQRDLCSLPLLAEKERAALVIDVNRTDDPSFLNHDLYSIATRHCTPANHKNALVCNGTALSYADLLRAVESVAVRLSEAGVAEQELVGICLPRSPDMVAAMLAILRRGNAYVPLDPAFPRERLSYMVEHSRLAHIITSKALRPLFDGQDVRFLELDDGNQATGRAPEPAKPPAMAKAYVIYTSGSTGRPKGVAVPREAVANFLLSMLERPGIHRDDTLCSVTTLSFDIAVLELLAPLCAGATVVIATEEEARDPRLLAALLQAHQVTLLQATPITWQMLCAAGWSGDKALTALCGGEALAPTLAQALAPRVRALWNMYGPTETTVWSTCHRIDDPHAAISVGTPIHNTSVYVLDDHRRPVPAGVEGQLFIGGSGVVLGYLHDEELTSRRFLPDPFRGKGRMYDTGDRARFDYQGLLYVVGRSDSQVKLRGFRIELGEIETRLSALAGIEQVVCIVRRDDPENPELVAYYVLEPSAREPSVAELRQHCAATLPAYMVPSRFARLDALPLTPNGKVDRKALPKLDGERPPAAAQAAPSIPRSDLERSLVGIWSRVLSISTASVNDNFFELGGTSLAAFSVAQQITRQLGVEIPVLKIFEHPTIAALAQFLRGSQADNKCVREAYQRARTRRRAAASETAFDVAIVGAAGRFPGARSLDQLWQNLYEGRETVTFFRRDELDPLVPAHDRNDPNYIPARGVLEDADLFDAAFFGINPNDAELMDPQLRIFMEVAWEAFENAGYVGEQIDGLVGVWAGMGNNFYYHYNVLTRPDKLAVMGEITAEIANEKDHIAPRVSHKLNLTGPSLSVHTACSTTLVVVENAYQALVSHQVDVALAGGVDIRTPQKSGQRYEEGGVFSIDGHCRPFDAAATGTMFGEGAGAIVLKRLDDALRDHDSICAIIKGAAVNHDGGHKVSYLAPSVEGQARVIASALALGDVNPDTITYVEAHGTATPIGDPIEVESLTRVFRTFTQRRNFCALGSIKGNFGHATTAAGIAGILKVVLALRHRKIPPTLHFCTPNPHIDFAGSPFFVNSKLIDWEPRGIPRRASVSSFGFCGTNAYVVLEEAPATEPSSSPARPAQLVLLSARSPKALDDAAERLSTALQGASQNELADASFTTQVGRKRFEYRRCAVLRTAEEARHVLTQASSPLSLSLKSESDSPPVAFMFPGQGSQYINMGLRLYQGEELFRETVDRCAAALAPHLGCDLRRFLFPDPADAETATQSLNNTFYTQPAIFTVSYALASLLMHWGIQPSAFIGHSIGEFVAATFSGVMDLDEALRLVATRGRLMQSLPPGSMLSLRLPVEKLAGRLPPGVDLAAVNGPQLCVVAGPTDTLQRLSEELAADGTMCRMLHTSHAFHSSMMDPVVEPFLRTVESVRLSPPRIPFVSTVTGDWIKPSEVTNPSYWAGHLRSPVQFSKAVQVLLQDTQQAMVECGPRRTCVALAHQHRPANPGRVISCMPDSAEPDDEYSSLLLALGSLWLNGCTVDWPAFHDQELRRRVALPGYPFQRKRYWLEPGNTARFGLDAAPRSQPVAPAAAQGPGSNGEEEIGNRDEVMAALVALLEETLGAKLESFDANAQFIALGFDSLLVTQLARIVRVRLGFPVTFRQLTERYSTPKLLADAVRAARATAPAVPAADAQPARPAAAADAPPASVNATAQVPRAGDTPAGSAAGKGRVPGARLGHDQHGRLAWFAPDPNRPGKYLKVENHE
jgi:amino acid adenylation domain-containing protein